MKENEIIPDNLIRERIVALMNDHPKLDAQHIEVEVRDGTVTLKGKADTVEESELATIIATSVAGVRHVDNHLHTGIGVVHAVVTLASRLSADPDLKKEEE